MSYFLELSTRRRYLVFGFVSFDVYCLRAVTLLLPLFVWRDLGCDPLSATNVSKHSSSLFFLIKKKEEEKRFKEFVTLSGPQP